MSQIVKKIKKKNSKKNVLITGVGGPAGINISKLMQKYKKYFKTYGVDINKNSAGQFFVETFSLCPKVSDEEKYLKYFKNFIKKNNIEILIPTVAEELILMQNLKSILDKEKINCEIIVSEHAVLELCDKKDKLYEWMTENFPTYIGKWQVLDKKPTWDNEFYFIKPIKGRGSRGCRQVSKKELNFLLENDASIKDFIAMEVLPGREWTVDCYINNDGSFAYIVPRLRLSLSGGITSTGKTDKNKTVIEQTKKVFEKLSTLGKIYGPVFIQWKEDQNGDVKMVEINPRASGGLPVTALAGADPIECLKCEIFGPKPCTNLKWKEITVTRHFEEKVV